MCPLRQTPDTLPPPCRSVPSSSTLGNLLPSAAGAVLLSLSSIFPWSRQPAAGHPNIVGANIHTLLDGMSSGQKPRLPQRWLKVKVKSLSCVRLFATPWTVAYQAPPSMGFSRQEYWSGLPFPSPGDLPHPGIKSPAFQADALTSEPPDPGMAGEFLNPCRGVQMSCCLVPPAGSSHSKAKMGCGAGARHKQKKASLRSRRV